MASPLGLLGKFFGNTVSEGAAFAAGIAVAPTLHPVVQAIANEAWAAAPDRPPDAVTLAMGVAQGQVDPAAATQWARETGFGTEAFAALVDIANTGPPLGSALDAFRRGLLKEAEYRTALKRQGIEDAWADALVALANVLLTPDELANAVVQGHRSFDAAAVDAEKQGVTLANFQTMVDNTGLPPGPETLVAWKRRGILTDEELAQGIREGHTKVKYIDAYRQAEQVVLSATTYAGLRLRGWITPAESYVGGELTGYTREQMDQLFLDRGRPATTHQVHIGYQRGGRYIGENLDERATFDRAVKQSDIRPEWGDILWAQRYTYPSAFVLRALTQSGDLTGPQTEQILAYSGWEPVLAKEVAGKWAQGTGSAVKAETASNLRAEYEGMHITRAELVTALEGLGYPTTEASALADLGDYARVKKYRDAVVTATYKAFVGHLIQEADARADLAQVGISAEAVDDLLGVWKVELAVTRKGLTQAQIKSAYKKSIIDLPTALQELADKGLSQADATTYLSE